MDPDMLKLFECFNNDDDGAITVDWVVLTAGIVLLAALVGNEMRKETSAVSERIAVKISEINPSN